MYIKVQILLIIFCFAYAWIDIQIQILDEDKSEFASSLCKGLHKKAELNMIQVIHDLKNHIIAIENLVDDDEECDQLHHSYNLSNNGMLHLDFIDDVCSTKICSKCKKIFKYLKYEIDFETSDLLEMLENLKFTFNLGQSMEVVEKKVNVSTYQIIQSICKTHKKLAIIGINEFDVQVKKFFPKNLIIPKIIFKKVLNNVISNSLKHTQNGKIEILFDQSLKINDICDKLFPKEQIHVGSDLIINENYIQVLIKDNGQGIPLNKLKLIFGDQQSDQSQMNQNGTGLGLPICAAILQKAGGFIRYWSVENQGTQFCIFQPHPLININSDQYYQQTQLQTISNPNLKCNLNSYEEIFIALDNK